jgi:hypothetical protein
MATMMTLSSTPTIVLDWPSLAWTTILAGLTFSCLAIKARFAWIAQQGALARALAHVVIGYFGLGMMIFGASAAARGRFPVPGGAAWEGPIAIVGGLAALVIGSTTLAEHVLSVRAAHREAEMARASASN